MAWRLPGAGRITSPYGPRVLPGAVSTFHYGTDLGTKRTAVYAAADGVVRTIWQTARGAWVVDLRHADEGGRQIRTRYIHMYRNEIRVVAGQRVTAGQRIGNSGASGTSAAHLHFEVLVDGVNVDPVPFMAARGVQLGTATVSNPIGGGTPPAIPSVSPPNPITEDDMFNDQDRATLGRAAQDASDAERNAYEAQKTSARALERATAAAQDASDAERNAYEALQLVRKIAAKVGA